LLTRRQIEKIDPVSTAFYFTPCFHSSFYHVSGRDHPAKTCSEYGGAVKVIACIENPMVIEKILTHLNEKAASAATGLLLQVQAPPQAGLFD